jgi:hypothetical protein
MVDATPAHVWLVAQTRRGPPGSPLTRPTGLVCGRPERPAWSEPSPDAPGHGINHLVERRDAADGYAELHERAMVDL